ncbi:MAG: A/G-specific adenine glycosylase [Nitrospinae bacterium]|nr:A/G-specific adenine glycosylase [Nitrospinota bacterium]
MLQQTQVNRVAQLFPPFVRTFPSFKRLAEAPLAEVLRHWSGLGYNRRGKWLREAATIIHRDHRGRLPRDPATLVALPGVGKATAASIAAFAYDEPTVFLETNIRAVFIHHFFRDAERVSDGDLLPLAEATLDREAPGQWYSAMMDYGTELKRVHGNPTRRSAAHKRQEPFEGSQRQVRGGALKRLIASSVPLSAKALAKTGGFDLARTQRALDQLVAEGLVTATPEGYVAGSS